jgi:hypothetical protein
MSGNIATMSNFRHLAPITVDEARAGGFVVLTPLEKAVAIEFATTGATLREIAQTLHHTLADVKVAFNNPICRAFIHDLQMEIAQHKVINAAWVEAQVLKVWPQLTGEEEVYTINKAGEEVYARKFHGPEVTSILKHFSGNADQKAAGGGLRININFGELGVEQKPSVTIDG